MSTASRARVAAFDVDGTVTRKDCVVPFLRLVGGTPALGRGQLYRAGRVVPMLTRRDRDALKALVARTTFADRSAAEVAARGRTFASIVHAGWLRADTMDVMAAHRELGDEVVLVSASFEAYLVPLGDRLGVDGVLGTRLAAGPGGRLTGELDGPNCRGAEKVRRLHAWLDRRHGSREAVEVVAYGDSPGDRELLADADVAHWIAPLGRRWG